MVLVRSNLTPRDREILDVLTRRVRVLSAAQVGRTWFADTSAPIGNALRRLRQLEQAGLVERFTVLAHPELELQRPLATWRPRQSPPDFARLSYRLVSRWREGVVDTPAVIASRAAGHWLGGSGGRRPRTGEASHDLSLSGVFLHWRAAHPGREASWISEAGLRRLGYGEGRRLPDAMIIDGEHRCVIELGGAYGSDKLQDFHQFCASQGLPYELW